MSIDEVKRLQDHRGDDEACLAIIAISAGTAERSARSARIVRVRPPPTQRTAPE
jgi:hypothetical protein